jgi:predicted TIM-barrel fold metal-dependent hydrolase
MPIDVPVLDPHIHLWDPRSTPRTVTPALKLFGWSDTLLHRVGPRLFPRAAGAFVGRTNYVLAPYLPGDWVRDHHGVDVTGFIHVEAGWHGRGRLGPAGETRWLESLCGAELRGIIAHAELDAPHLAALLDAHVAASARVVGVRDITSFDADRAVMKWTRSGARMRSRKWRRGLALLGERRLTFDAWCYHPQLADLAAAAAEAKETRIVLCHLGTPIGYAGPFGSYGTTASARDRIRGEWKDGLARVAAQPNVHAKISGLVMPILGFGFHDRPTPPGVAELVDKLGPLVEVALETFGPARCFFASNFPIDKVSAPWTTIYAAFAALVRSLDAPTRRGLFAENAARFYGAPRAASRAA